MKKNLAGLFVAAAMVVSLCACGSGGSGSTTAEKTSEAAAGAATEAAAGAAAGGGDAVTLTYVTWIVPQSDWPDRRMELRAGKDIQKILS